MKKRIYNIPQLFHLNALFTKVVALIMVATLSGMMPVNAQVNAQVTGNNLNSNRQCNSVEFIVS